MENPHCFQVVVNTKMSHHSDDNLLVATSDSFWEPGNYKRTTKRIEDGYKLCNDLMTLIQERADIEKTYSKNLKGWAKKWNELIEKGKLLQKSPFSGDGYKFQLGSSHSRNFQRSETDEKANDPRRIWAGNSSKEFKH